jgi:hypothetical protein
MVAGASYTGTDLALLGEELLALIAGEEKMVNITLEY